jgi:hypothetical protein
MTTTAEPPPVAGPMILTAGLDCHQPAEIQWRAVVDSTDRPAEHVKILCAQRHWFVLPVASIAGVAAEWSSADTTLRPHPAEPDIVNGHDLIKSGHVVRLNLGGIT